MNAKTVQVRTIPCRDVAVCRRPFTLACALLLATACLSPAAAQHDGHDAPANPAAKRPAEEPGWVEQIGPGGLVDWSVRCGQIIDKDGVHLGGPSTARLTAPLSERFKLRLDYLSPNPQEIRLRFHRESMFSGGFMERRLSMGGAGQWVEMTIAGDYLPQGQYQLKTDERHANGGGSSTTTGNDAIDWIEIEVPAGQSLVLRRIALLSTARSAAPHSLYPAVAALILFLFGIMGLGWFLNRRRRPALGQ
jgi:hypothetical protein